MLLFVHGSLKQGFANEPTACLWLPLMATFCQRKSLP